MRPQHCTVYFILGILRTGLWSQGNSLFIAGEKKENENTGLDFPISIENWFNLSTIEHVIHILFCILSVWLFFVVVAVIVCLFILFSVYFVSVSSSVIFPMLHLLFLWPFILLILLLIFLKPLLLSYLVENSESADRKTALQSGKIWAPFTRIRI